MSLRKIFILSFILFCVCNIGVFSIDPYMKNDVTPQGIISFELIGTIQHAHEAFTAWGATGQMAAGLSIGLDYLYIFLYLIMGMSGFRLITQKTARYSLNVARFIRYFSFLCPLTALCDFTENYALIQLLTGSQNTLWPRMAHLCATGKFTGSALCLLLALAGFLFATFQDMRNQAAKESQIS
ncbi:hypothetical protein VA7868_04215 [Vibrio aerogenes CECT 7868]|uniref:Uncharacterized protein n=1 Tax=Vibrio aerogenes CECT 7868 TaxID=1216006 RepID=A0A1M6DFE4_9VIBR|nr:hypothetical protein [Vibrio aerogenes]SHI71880.1 hypothetical protein VA7868_04215 [Vibrio aerogenes CECT 7868]